jgi:hypothetical protein
MDYGFSVWRLDAMEHKWSKLLVANVKPPSRAVFFSPFPSVSSLHIYTPSAQTLTNPFLTLLDVCVYFSFTFTPGVVVWAASALPCTCVVEGSPGRYRRGLQPRQSSPDCLSRIKTTIMKQLFRDFEWNVCSANFIRFNAALKEIIFPVKGKY